MIVLLFVSGCGGGSSDTQEDIILNDPNDDISAYITTATNDLDSNGVQDAVDERISARFTNPREYTHAIKVAETMQGIVNSHYLNDGNEEQAVRDFVISTNCHSEIFGDDSWNQLQFLQGDAFSTSEQYAAYVEITDKHHQIFDEVTNSEAGACS